jgi:hypothetical protein
MYSSLIKKLHYTGTMTTREGYLVYPDGDVQELFWPLSINQIVDLNGKPLDFPLTDPKIIAYRVQKIRRVDGIGTETTYYGLELVSPTELAGY